MAEFDELTNLLQVPICSGTVNGGSEVIAGGLVANDYMAFCGISIINFRNYYYFLRNQYDKGDSPAKDLSRRDSKHDARVYFGITNWRPCF
jgi:eIF-6 family